MKYTKEEVYKATLEYFDGDELATDVWIKKYAMTNEDGELLEKTPDDMHERLANEFARIEKNYPNPLNKNKILSLLNRFRYVVPQGSPMAGIGNLHNLISFSNCVVVGSPDDNISSIFDKGRDIANLTKRRCGVGIDISQLRPAGSGVHNSAKTTTGAWSFSEHYSNIGRMIGQGGRRAALLISLDCSHPDVERFVTMKTDLTKVVGANISVKITDDFMNAVYLDTDFELVWTSKDKKTTVKKFVKAKDLWDLICKTARDTAEPGILFWDRVLSHCPASSYLAFKAISTNACSELPLSELDACRLISINLKSFVIDAFTEQTQFDFDKFKDIVSCAQRLMDDLVELELERLVLIEQACDTEDEKAIWRKLHSSGLEGRRTGLSTNGLADCLSCLNLRFDSEAALSMTDKIFEALRDAAYNSSVQLAIERGAFPAFDWELEKDNAFILSLPENIRENIKAHGRRNIALLTSAPAGSVSIVSKTSSGIEPVFRNSYIRRRKVDQNEGLEGTEDAVGDSWIEYQVEHPNVADYKKKMNTDVLPDYFVTAEQIDWKKRIELQSIIGKYIDHNISSTINLPEETTFETVQQIYEYAHQKGLKGITVYREGSRDAVLVSQKNKGKLHPKNPFRCSKAPKRPKVLTCDIHRGTVKGEDWVVFIGLLDGKPYELFAGTADMVEIPQKYKTGLIQKTKFQSRSRYDLLFGDNNEIKIKDIVRAFDNPNNGILTRMVSLSLRHGAKPSFIVEQLGRSDDSDFTSFNKVVARMMKKYIEDGEKVSGADKVCPECGAELAYQEGCVMCLSCGFTKCN